MHVVYYSPGWPPEGYSNGVITYVNQMRRQMLARGHSVTILAPQRAEGAVQVVAKDGQFLSRLRRSVQTRLDAVTGINDSFAAAMIATLKRIHARQPIDVLEIEESFGWAEQLRRALPFPVVVRLHGPHCLGQVEQNSGLSGYHDATRRRREGMAIRNARYITSMSSTLLEKTLLHYGLKRSETKIIYNPIEACIPAGRWDIESSDPNLVLFVGRFDARKGGDIALQAFGIAAQKFPTLRLIVAGSDSGIRMPNGDVLHIRQYAESQLRADVASRVDYLGLKTPAELRDLRKRARAVIIPSRFEIAPYTLLEALALGVPVVSSTYFAAAEHLVGRVNGLTAPIGDFVTFADQLVLMLSNPELAARVGLGGWRLCSDRFNPEKICLETERLYQSLVSPQAIHS